LAAGPTTLTLGGMGTRVLVVDDQAAFRAVVRELLTRAGFDVVGEASDGAGALAAQRALHPDVVLLDVRLPDMSGVDVARSMTGHSGAPAVVLTSTDDYRYAVAGSGAVGFVAKSELTAELLRAELGGDR
jgi:DNA-binding NarL/FixJ family response regulator